MFKKLLKITGIIVAVAITVSGASFFQEIKMKKKQRTQENIHKPYGLYEKYIKRPLDAFLATGALFVFSPVMLVIALLIKIKMGSPVIFSQERPGMIDADTGQEKIFRLYKFRTMTNKVDSEGKPLPDKQRLTAFGRWLRSTSLDELPELINIIKGDMSLVGPRPLLVQYLPYYTEKERHRHDVRPGLSGLAQVSGRNYLHWDDRLALDVKYAEKITFWGDIGIITKTMKKVVMKEDVAANSQEADEAYLDEIRKGYNRNGKSRF